MHTCCMLTTKNTDWCLISSYEATTTYSNTTFTVNIKTLWRQAIYSFHGDRYTGIIAWSIEVEGYFPVSLRVNGRCNIYVKNISRNVYSISHSGAQWWFVCRHVHPLIAIPFTRWFRSYKRGIYSIWCYSKHHWIQIVSSVSNRWNAHRKNWWRWLNDGHCCHCGSNGGVCWDGELCDFLNTNIVTSYYILNESYVNN